MTAPSISNAPTARQYGLALDKHQSNYSSCDDGIDSAIEITASSEIVIGMQDFAKDFMEVPSAKHSGGEDDQMEKLYRSLTKKSTKDSMEVALVKSSDGGGDDHSLAATATSSSLGSRETTVTAGGTRTKLPRRRRATALKKVISRILKKSKSSDQATVATDGSSYNNGMSSGSSNDKTSLVGSATKLLSITKSISRHQVRATPVDERLFGPDDAMSVISFTSAAPTVTATNSDPDSSKAVREIRKANVKLRRMYQMSSLIDKDEYDNEVEESCMVWGCNAVDEIDRIATVLG